MWGDAAAALRLGPTPPECTIGHPGTRSQPAGPFDPIPAYMLSLRRFISSSEDREGPLNRGSNDPVCRPDSGQHALHRPFPLGVGIHPADRSLIVHPRHRPPVARTVSLGKECSRQPHRPRIGPFVIGPSRTVQGPPAVQAQHQRRAVASSSPSRHSPPPKCGRSARSSSDDRTRPNTVADEHDETRYTLYGPAPNKASHQTSHCLAPSESR